MLCQFSVRNFKSVRDEATLDMQAVSISEHQEHLIRGKDGKEFLPTAVIYGPNGGGKTNVLSAVYSMHLFVMNPARAARVQEESWRVTLRPFIKPFAFLEETRNSPTEFEEFFRTQTAEYRYVLHVQDGTVCFELLERVKMDTRRKSSLFQRNENGIQLKGDFAKLHISNDVSDTLPFLSYLFITYMKNEVVQDLWGWFANGALFINYGDPVMEVLMGMTASGIEDEGTKKLLLDMLHEMDLDIEDYRVEKKKNEEIQIFTAHLLDGRRTELKLEEESRGTQKLLALLVFVLGSLRNGSTLVVDELDARLHPVLLRYLIMRFNDPEVNLHGAQLIFTSHDLSTMNSEVFRRDEIWFVAKGGEQESHLYSLVEFKTEDGESVRKDARYDKQYLEGRYGADPYLRKIIHWGEENGKENVEERLDEASKTGAIGTSPI